MAIPKFSQILQRKDELPLLVIRLNSYFLEIIFLYNLFTLKKNNRMNRKQIVHRNSMISVLYQNIKLSSSFQVWEKKRSCWSYGKYSLRYNIINLQLEISKKYISKCIMSQNAPLRQQKASCI